MKTGQRLHFKQVHYVSSRQIAEVLRTADRHTIIVEVVDFFSLPSSPRYPLFGQRYDAVFENTLKRFPKSKDRIDNDHQYAYTDTHADTVTHLDTIK